MGITIHYKGKINSPGLTDSFLEEVEDISKSMGWKFYRFDFDEKDKMPVKGLFIEPHHKAELLQFMIDKNGDLRNAIILEHSEPNDSTTFLNHIKTQFSPIDVHIAIIKLLKYLKKKYISNLEVQDEGDYWNSGDAKILHEKFDFLNKKMDEFGAFIESIEIDKDSTTMTIADKIEAILRQRSKNE